MYIAEYQADVLIDNVALLTVQLMSHIMMMPEKNVALVQMPQVPNKRGHMTVNVKQPDQHYSYIDMTNCVWDCKAHIWRRRRSAESRSSCSL